MLKVQFSSINTSASETLPRKYKGEGLNVRARLVEKKSRKGAPKGARRDASCAQHTTKTTTNITRL